MKIIIHLHEINLEGVAGGKNIREGIVNCIEFFKKKILDDDLSKLMILAINDLEKIL